jgi:hypothetical protein
MQNPFVEWPLVCRECGERGTVKIQEREVVGTTGGFFLKSEQAQSTRHRITCAACGQQHPPPPG